MRRMEKKLVLARKICWLLPGILLFMSFPPAGEVVDILFALSALIWVSRQGNPGMSTKRWFFAGLTFWLTNLAWMPAIVKNGGPAPLVALGWFALAAYCAAYFAAYGYLSAVYWREIRKLRENSPRIAAVGRCLGVLLVEPILWCGLELVRSCFLGGFAWNQLGVVAANTGFGAPAVLGGVYLLSAIIMLVNGSIAGIAERVVAIICASRRMEYDKSAVSRFRSLETLGAFALIFTIYHAAWQFAVEPEDGPYLKVAMVQRNFPCCFKARTEDPVAVYSNLLSQVTYMQPDMVLLSESAMSEFGPLTGCGAKDFAEWVIRETKARSVLAGGSRRDLNCEYNSAGLYCNYRTSVSIYDKVHLVPFGEFIPLDNVIPWLRQFAPVGSCTPGEPHLLSFDPQGTGEDQVPFGTAICYEDTDSALVRGFAAEGARFLCFITNDAWFSHSDEALAHAWQATARAIETGLTVVRVGNSGATGTILPDGSTNWLSDGEGRVLVDKSGVMLDRINIGRRELTPYVKIGDVPLALFFVLLTGGIILIEYCRICKLRKI